jgi:predicted nucleic acid-binding protein
VYLLDTDVLSESRKEAKANAGVRAFFRDAQRENAPLYVSVVTIGEIRRGLELIRRRGETAQADRLERWLQSVTESYGATILPFDEEMAQVWGRLRVPHPENALDKQIAATALMHDLAVVTRNVPHFESTGVRLVNPFA